ncbi:MAG: 1,4-dihydroxy-2-naphthoate octaprenyltransferase [Bdellovibrionota bacterium]
MKKPGAWKSWISAARPKTLIAAFLPVAAAWVLAQQQLGYRMDLVVWALLSALALQIATNFWNDYFDDLKGSDSDERLGPRRLLQLKLATRSQVKAVAIAFNVLSFLMAIPIFQERGWGLAALGVLCVLLSIAYTGGPFPLAYLGLGEFFVLLFFGWVATFFSYYVATGLWSFEASVLGVQVGLLSCVLITINNLRDYPEDKKNKKNTLVVKFGRAFGLTLLAKELFFPYLINFAWRAYPKTYLVFLAFPLASLIFYKMKKGVNPNQQLAFASLHALLFLCLWSLGILMP